MQYRIDKKSGNRLSVLGFGCMRFPRNLGAIDMKRTETLIMKAIEGGVNYFDTAYIYPGSEEALGAILAKNSVREKVFIATKLPIVLVKDKADFDRFFNKELERLRTDYIDYYLMHQLTDMDFWDMLKNLGIEEWIAEQKKSGRIRQAGFSFHGTQAEFLKLVDVYPWDFCQIQYNYSDENFQAGTIGLKKASEMMPVIIMEPLLGGKLTEGLPQEAASIFKKADSHSSLAAWGLNWVWNHTGVTLLLSGMSSEAQLEENIRLADASAPGMLGPLELDVYHQVLNVFNKFYKIHCTGCNYCMPCPQGVNIPGCFAGYNLSYSMGFVLGLKHYITSIAAISEKTAGVGLCVKCGKCEKICPQRIPIIRCLEDVKKRMEPFWYRWVIGIARFVLGKNGKKNLQ
ncbi:MAG: aldo/keto reductase [Treponema sp.]|jgi:predicted aldo/keto reductase-like oxidoreductase|nr:aldo/keto reductase [Treponema sp.]